jgi:hypothetical protein
MALVNNAPPPIGDRISQGTGKGYKAGEDPKEGLVTQPWADWFIAFMSLLSKASGRVAGVTLLDQNSAVGPTDMTEGSPLTAGTYRLNYFLAINGLASVGPASTGITVQWQYRQKTRTFTSPGVDSSAGFVVEQFTLPMAIDALSPVDYTVNYSSDEVYDLFLILEELDA